MTLNDVLEGHYYALKIGGHPGIRDQGLIESAIARPYNGYYRPIAKKAAALVHSLCKNHGFIDGNKRTALYTMDLLLKRSGYTLVAVDVETLNLEVEQMILDVAENRMTFELLVEWFKGRIQPL